MTRGKYYGLELNNLDSYLENRKELVKKKLDAFFTQYHELDGILNLSKFAKRFLDRSESWLSQRINGCMVMDKQQDFNPEEYEMIAQGFRELAKQLNQYAAELESAEYKVQGL